MSDQNDRVRTDAPALPLTDIELVAIGLERSLHEDRMANGHGGYHQGSCGSGYHHHHDDRCIQLLDPVLRNVYRLVDALTVRAEQAERGREAARSGEKEAADAFDRAGEALVLSAKRNARLVDRIVELTRENERLRSEAGEALKALMQDDGDNGGWDNGMRILTRLSGFRIPALEVVAKPIDVSELVAQPATDEGDS